MWLGSADQGGKKAKSLTHYQMSENKLTQQDLELGSIPGILAVEESSRHGKAIYEQEICCFRTKTLEPSAGL